MDALFTSGRAVDLVLIFLALEVGFVALRRRQSLGNIVVAALPGACLLMALRAALTGAEWFWVAFWVALSLPAHLFDLWRRPV